MCRPSLAADPKAAYLQRARFLAIAEFGPRSLIYHEGRAYRVYKAKLPPGIRTEEGGRLATDDALCLRRMRRRAPATTNRNAAMPADAPMGGIHPIRNVLRIDNVETQPAERITANDEDRQRQGFEIQTVFAWPRRDGRLDVTESVASDEDGPILSLAYAPGATISRLNKGLRRRKEKSIFGFGIDPATGRWTGSQDEGDDDDARRGRQSSASCRSSRTTRTHCCFDCPRPDSPKPRWPRCSTRLRAGSRSSSSSRKARCQPSRCRRVTGGAPFSCSRRPKAAPACSVA